MRHLRALLVLFLVLLMPLTGFAEQRVIVDHVEFDEKSMLLTVHADVLDVTFTPIEKLKEKQLEILASGKPLKIKSMEIETAEEAKEPVAVLILMNASNSYRPTGEGEVVSPLEVEKNGVKDFIKSLRGTDKVAVLAYRQDSTQDQIYPFGSSFTQAVDSVAAYKGAQESDDLGLEGSEKGMQKSDPPFVRAVRKSLDYYKKALPSLGSTRRRYLIIMSDGKDTLTKKTKIVRKFERMTSRFKEYGIRVMAIGYSADDQDFLATMQTLTEGTKGLYRRVKPNDLSTVPAVWDGFAARIKKQYILKATLEELPDNGEPMKGKDLMNYVVSLKVDAGKDGPVEGEYQDVKLPKPSFDWKALLMWIGIALGALIGLGVLIGLIVMLGRRRGGGETVYVEQEYDGPDRGKLHVRAGPLSGEIFHLIDDVTTIGSMKGNTIIIEDGSVSRRHAALKIDQMRYEIADMNSTNGVLVNGKRIHKIFLRDGDKITIGSTEMEFRLK
ncbi:MAG: FHA domain-containing protein [Myxococcales bacterium]|nr:FHA domain-containing protein [Myxococcales bacterium]